MNTSKLRGKMAERGCSQSSIAEKMGISVQSLDAKINNRSQFTVDQAMKLIEILEIDNPNDIFLLRTFQIRNTKQCESR
jgi:plasmid maintenance system antidote protein VapI